MFDPEQIETRLLPKVPGLTATQRASHSARLFFNRSFSDNVEIRKMGLPQKVRQTRPGMNVAFIKVQEVVEVAGCLTA